jgi:hypothetical protein
MLPAGTQWLGYLPDTGLVQEPACPMRCLPAFLWSASGTIVVSQVQS